MSEYAIRVENLKKKYKLGLIGGGSLTNELQSWFAKKLGKEDPNLKIGQEERLVGETFMALNGINLKIKKGEKIGIIGRNGAGKSTLLKILSRVTAPTEGDVWIEGRIASMLEVGTGFHGELTGRQNIYMNGAILGMPPKEIDKKIEQIIDFSEVRDFIDTPVKRYSSGMYVKLAFAVASHLDAEIMIMDEVLAVGDIQFQEKCIDRMRELANTEGRTILYVSHNMGTIRRLCTKVAVLDEGKLIFEGDVDEGINKYRGERQENKKLVNLAELPRTTRTSSSDLRMQEIKISDRDLPIYEMGEPIKLNLVVKSKTELDNIFVRMTIKTPVPEAKGITMVNSDKAVRIQKKVLENLKLKIETKGIVPGKYTLTPVIYQVNKYGNQKILDSISFAFTFEVKGKIPGLNNITWNTEYWGHIYGNKLIIKK